MGDSAGGTLSLALCLRLREAKLPQPACMVLLSPALDATFSGESYNLNSKSDLVLRMDRMDFFMRAYTNGASKKNPLISPIFANLRNLPPILVHVGTEELLLSDSETLARNAQRDGADVTLYEAEGMWHGWHFFASYMPEAKSAMRAVAEFTARHTA